MNKVIVIILLFMNGVVTAQIKSPFNQIALSDSLENEFSFVVSGHFHGSSQNLSGYPASTLLANLDLLNNSGAAFLCSTGDMFLDVSNNIPNYKRSFFNKLAIPVFNAVGNHDLTGKVYQQNFGNTWFSFVYGNGLFIFVDTEINNGSIQNNQLEFLKSTLEKSDSKNIFIFSHRPIWAEENEQLNNVFLENTKSDFGVNYNDIVYPLLQKASFNHKIYWFSGSLGGQAPASFFYHQQVKNITYIQSAIRDLPRDAVLKVVVNNDKVAFQTISLTQNPAPKVEDCNLAMWNRKSADQPFNYRLIPLYLKQMFFHRYFWYGVVWLVLFYLSSKYFIRSIIRKKRGAKA